MQARRPKASGGGAAWRTITGVNQRWLWLGAVLSLLVACSDETSGAEDDDGDASGGAGAGQGGTGATDNTGGTTSASGGSGGDTSSTGGAPGTGGGDGGSPPAGCGPDGVALIAAINDYRADHALPPIVASSSLCIVAETHVNDLRDNAPHTSPNCNLHSWSDQGTWTPCCYTPDHAQASCMWMKPSELASYPSEGYEISASGTSTPTGAVQLWANSSGHNAVILNQGTWANLTWNAIGAAQHDGFAHVWFGVITDPND